MSDQSEKTDQTNRFDEDPGSGDRPLSIPGELPVLPLRDTVLFPNSFMPLAVAREASVRLIDEATTSGRMIGVFTQREASVEEPLLDDLYTIGTATHIHKMFKLPDGSLRLIVQGLARVTLDELIESRPYLRARVSPAAEVFDNAGFPAYTVSNSALRRAADYLFFLRTKTGNADWYDGTRSAELKHLINRRYGLTYPVTYPVGPGRTVGFTDWTHP